MTDLCLMGVFFLCAVIGRFVVSRGRGFLEQMLFRNSESWYNLDRDYTSVGSELSRFRRRIARRNPAGHFGKTIVMEQKSPAGYFEKTVLPEQKNPAAAAHGEI